MATEPATPTATPLPALQEEEEAKKRRLLLERRQLREAQLHVALQELDARHQEERRALSQELRELSLGRKAIQDQVWADWISSPFPDLGPGRHNLTPEQQRKLSAELKYLQELSREDNRRSSQQEDGASSSAAGAALNGKDGPGEGDEEIPNWPESFLKASQQRDKEKQALLKELLPAKSEVRVEMQCLLEVLEERELRKVYDHRIKVEDPREIKAHQRTLAARRAGLWRFVSKKKVKAKRKLVELEGTANEHIAFVDDKRLGPPRLPWCYEEIKNLLDIETNPILSRTLQEWNRKQECYNLREQNLKNQLANMKNEVYQLFGFFSVFQGVVLTAVSNSSLLYCHNKWSPIALSVLASAISVLAGLQKWNRINDLRWQIYIVQRNFATAVQVGQRLQELGPKGVDFTRLDADIEYYRRYSNGKLKLSILGRLYFMVIILILVAFGVLFPISFWRILCQPGSPPSPPAQ